MMVSASGARDIPMVVDTSPAYDFMHSLALVASASRVARLPAESPWRHWLAETQHALDPAERRQVRRWFGGQHPLDGAHVLLAESHPHGRTPAALIAAIADLTLPDFARLLLLAEHARDFPLDAPTLARCQKDTSYALRLIDQHLRLTGRHR